MNSVQGTKYTKKKIYCGSPCAEPLIVILVVYAYIYYRERGEGREREREEKRERPLALHC